MRENFCKEVLHGLPGAAGGAFVIGDPFRRVVTRRWNGKSVYGSAVYQQLPVDFCIIHFFLEGSHLIWWHVWIIRPVEHEDFSFYVFGISGGGRIETTMKRDGPSERSSGASQFENGRAPRSNSRSPPRATASGLRLRQQRIQGRFSSGTHQRPVSFIEADLLHRLLRILGSDAFAVNISSQRDIAQFGKLFGPILREGTHAHPVGNNNDARSLRLHRIIVDKDILQGRFAFFIVDCFPFELRMCKLPLRTTRTSNDFQFMTTLLLMVHCGGGRWSGLPSVAPGHRLLFQDAE